MPSLREQFGSLSLTGRSLNCLLNAADFYSLETAEQVLSLTDAQLLRAPNLGVVTLTEIRNAQGLIGRNTEPKVGGNRGNAGKGRKKGTPNKTTASMKEAIQHVYASLQESTGKAHGHFLDWADDNPTEFYKIASKLLPMQVEASVTVGLAEKIKRAQGRG